MQPHMQPQRVKKQQDVSQLPLKPATQGGSSLRGEVRKLYFMQMSCSTMGNISGGTAPLCVDSHREQIHSSPVRDEYVNDVLNANPHPKDTVSVGDNQMPAFSSVFGLINADMK